MPSEIYLDTKKLWDNGGATLEVYEGGGGTWWYSSASLDADALDQGALDPLLDVVLVQDRLGRREPSSPAKFALGLLFVGSGFAILVVAAQLAQAGVRVAVDSPGSGAARTELDGPAS